MNLKFLLCDDSDIQLKETDAFVHAHLDAVSSFTSAIDPYKPEELISLLDTGSLDYDIAILDIEMGSLNGIDLASRINQCCPSCAVIFLTSHTDYISESYEVRHIYYVTKDSMYEYLPKALDKAIQLTLNRKMQFLDIISNRKRHRLACDTITYIERSNREITIYTITGESYNIYESIQSVRERLPVSFSQCHSSYVINLAYMKCITSQEAELTDSTILPIGRRYAKAFKTAYLQYISEHAML